MIVCSCNVLSDHQIRSTIGDAAQAPQTPGQVYRCLGCSPQCGRCARTIRAMLADIRGLDPSPACATCPAACPAAGHGEHHDHHAPDDLFAAAPLAALG